jgi:transposase-like protein
MLKERNAPLTLADVMRFADDPDRALAFVVQLRWPSGIVCPRCGTDKPNFLKSRRIWRCKGCRKDFSVKVGTIFEDSPLGLDKWLPAIWLLANAKNGISSYELHRAIGVTQKTAWFMLSRIRLAMQSGSFEKMSGEVEVDEAFIGGKAEYMHKSRRRKGERRHGQWDKAMVLGMLQRKRGPKHSTVVLRRVPGVRSRHLLPHIVENVEKGTEVFTDALLTYKGLKELEFKHASVDHAVSYAQGKVHTNGLENFWSLLKRAIKGTYISVDPVHLFRYLDEQAYRFNERKKNDLQRFVGVLKDVVSKRLTYNELITGGMLPNTT